MKPVQPADRSYAPASLAPSASAMSADDAGNAISGVTVATITRSRSLPLTPASSSASRAAGSAMSLSASSLLAILRSRMPVRSWIHSSEVSTYCARSSFVTTRAGTWTPRPVMPILTPSVRPITSALHGKGQGGPGRQLVADVRGRSAATDGTPDLFDFARQSEHVARHHDALEAAVVDPGEEGDLAAELLLDEHGHRARLRHRLDDHDAGGHRPAREVPGEPRVLGPHLATRDDPVARLELEHLVEEEERLTVRDDLLDLRPPERRADHGHATAESSRSSSPRRPARARCA